MKSVSRKNRDMTIGLTESFWWLEGWSIICFSRAVRRRGAYESLEALTSRDCGQGRR
jgi:hypothetical protein